MSARMTRLKERVNKRWVRWVLENCATVRTSYVNIIAERNRLRDELSDSRRETADLTRRLDVVRSKHAVLTTAATRFISLIESSHETRPGALRVVIPDQALMLAFRTKLNNVAHALRGDELILDPFFDMPEPLGPSGRMH